MEKAVNERRKETTMMYMYRTLSRLGLVPVFLLVATTALAQDPTPSGTVAVESTSIAAGVGISWGEGTLKFQGQDYHFSVSGLSLINVGIARVNAVGQVYNLNEVSSFAGTYVAAEVGFALAGGMGGIAMRNQNGVVLHLRSVQEGAYLSLGPSGLTVKVTG